MYFASVYILFRTVEHLTTCIPYNELGRPYNFSFHSKDDFLHKLKQCRANHDVIDQIQVIVTKHSVEVAQYDEYTPNFDLKSDNGLCVRLKLDSKLRDKNANSKHNVPLDNWLKTIEPLVEIPYKFNHIIAVTDPDMACEVIGGGIMQSF